MSDSDLFIGFSTNANPVVTEVETALSRMNSLLSRESGVSFSAGTIDIEPFRAYQRSVEKILGEVRASIKSGMAVQEAPRLSADLVAAHGTLTNALPRHLQGVDLTGQTLDRVANTFGSKNAPEKYLTDLAAVSAQIKATQDKFEPSSFLNKKGELNGDAYDKAIAKEKELLAISERRAILNAEITGNPTRYQSVPGMANVKYDTLSDPNQRAFYQKVGGTAGQAPGYEQATSTAMLQAANAKLGKSLQDEAAAHEKAAQVTNAATAQRGGSGPQTPIQGFLGGFFGRGFGTHMPASPMESVTNLAASAGQAAKYMILYQSLQLVTQGFRDTIKEAADMEDSLRDLNIAMGQAGPASSEMIANLTMLSAFAGSNVGASMDAAARGIRAFTDAESTNARKEEVGTRFADAATKLALLTGTDLKDATGNVLAVANAWDKAGSSLSQVNDVLASVSARVGGDTKQISQGLASMAGAAEQAGFTMSEAGAAMGLVQARTDETGQAVATRLSRVFSILGGTTGRGIIDKINAAMPGDKIDPDASVRDQFQQIAKAYAKAAPELRGLIVNALGGSSNTKELLPILNNPDKVFGFEATAGEGIKQANERANGLAGTLRQLQGDLTAIQTTLAGSDLFTAFGIGLAVVEKLAKEVARLLSMFNAIKGAIPFGGYIVGAAALVAQLMLARKLFSTLGGFEGFKGIGSVWSGRAKSAIGIAGAAETGPISAAGKTVATEINVAGTSVVAALEKTAAGISAAGTAAAEAQVASGTKAAVASGTAAEMNAAGNALGNTAANGALAGAGKLASVAKVSGWIAGITAVLGVINLVDDVGKNTSDIAAARAAFFAGEGDLKSQIDAINSTKGTIQKGQGGLASTISQGNRNDYEKEAQSVVDLLQSLKDGIEKSKKIRDEQNINTINLSDSAAIQGEAQRLKEAGYSAEEVFSRISTSIKRFVNDTPYDLTQMGDQIAADLLKSVGDPTKFAEQSKVTGSPGFKAAMDYETYKQTQSGDSLNPFSSLLAGFGGNNESGNANILNEILSMQAKPIGEWTVGAARKASSMGSMTKEQANALATAQTQEFGDKFLEGRSLPKEVIDAAKTHMVEILRAQYEAYATGIHKTMASAETLTELEQAFTDVSGKTDSTQLAALNKMMVKRLQEMIASVAANGGNTGALMEALAKYQKQMIEAEITDAIKVLRVRQNGAATKAEAEQMARKTFSRLIQDAAATGNVDLVVSLLDQVDKQTFNIVKQALLDKIRIAEAAVSSAASESFFAAHPNSRTVSSEYTAAANTLHQLQASMAAINKGKQRSPLLGDLTSGTDWANRESAAKQAAADAKAAREKAKADAEKARQEALALAQAKNTANAAKSGGSIEQAQASLANARLTLNDAKKGTSAYYQALASFYGAQRELTTAILNNNFVKAQLGSDLTDPVAQAHLQLRKAKDKLASDKKSGAAGDVIAQDQLDIKNAQNSAEQAAFQQRLKDAQTGEQLGRMSHAAYIRYLKSEHDRFAAIQNRTRQQQDILDQVDQALKAARDATAGAFNLGDVKVPNAYEVRRFIAAQAAGVAYQGGQGSNTTTVYVNGADTAQVRSVLSGLLGPTAMATTGTGTRRS